MTRAGQRGIIPREWPQEEGLSALPRPVLKQISAVFDKMVIGEEMRTLAFFRNLSMSERPDVAYELVLAGMAYSDIGILFGSTRQAVYLMVGRAEDKALRSIGPNWISRSIVSTVRKLESIGQLALSKAHAAADDVTAERFLGKATTAFGTGASLLVRMAEGEAMARALREAGKRDEDKENPTPTDRISFMQYVYEKTLLENKPETTEAEIVPEKEATA